MKNSKNVLLKLTQLTVLILIICMQSCDTEIPPEDPTPPSFSFQIHGDGFYHDFTQDSDFDNIILNLRTGVQYEFTFTGADAGGVERINWTTSNQFILPYDVPSPWRYVFNNSEGTEGYQWVGDRSNPLTGGVLNGTFKVFTSDLRTTFRFSVYDFGGENSSTNSVMEELNIQTRTAHRTGIINL